MKKLIINLFVLALGVIMATGVTHATGERFNTDVRDLDTIMVAKNSCSAGAVDGCWKHSITASVGDTIGVQIYYHNTGSTTATDVAVGLNPNIQSGSRTTHTIEGGILSFGYKVGTGSAVVNLDSSARLELVDAKWFPNQSASGQSVNANALFDNYGLSIGSIAPGWPGQGTVVARFIVVGNNTPDDNDSCQINSFDADDTSIDDGDSTRLNWRTTGCDYVDIESNDRDFNNQNEDGSVSVSPDRTTTYTLHAYPGNVTRTVRINVDDRNNDFCYIDSFTASPSNITQGNTTTLRWNTSGDVDYVTLSGLSGQRSGDSSISVSPYTTTTYTLRAYCNNGNSQTSTTTVYVNTTNTSSAPQALTTIASVLNGTQARLNGIAIPNTTSTTTNAWFEWGIGSSYNNRTISQVVPLNNNSYPYSDFISGLVPGVTYTYRAVVQNQYGTAYGAPVSFRTTTPVVQPPVIRDTTIRNVVVAQSAASLLELRVESNYDRMCVNGLIDYTISYRNISSQTLDKAVLQFTHPKEITYLAASRGEYEVVDRTLTIALGNIAPGEQGIITINARVNDTAIRGNLTVATASVVYTNTRTRAQEDATAYSLITVSDDCPNLLGASTFGFGSFLPNTLLGWLLLILVILALIVLARQFQKKPVA